jgi:hypothetical protein
MNKRLMAMFIWAIVTAFGLFLLFLLGVIAVLFGG